MSNKHRLHNIAVFRKGIKAIIPVLESGSVITIAKIVSDAVYGWIDSHTAYYEDDTYNLRDSIGIGIYKQGVLVKWVQMPSPKATEGRRFSMGGKNYTVVHGRELLNEAIQGSDYANFAMFSFVLYATAPYGIIVEDGDGKRGTGWWSEGLVPYVKSKFIEAVSKHQLK